MSKTTMIHARVEPYLKQEAEAMLSQLGLNMTQAITLFLQQVRLQKGLPFEVKMPTEQTQKAIKEVEARDGKKFSTIDDLFDDLEN
ncbi:MAG: type II toxin-antitoxin system RelB/DinJ family antitoxin [Sulfurimonas sp.]|jgi:DNA-damage-inducible protein J